MGRRRRHLRSGILQPRKARCATMAQESKAASGHEAAPCGGGARREIILEISNDVSGIRKSLVPRRGLEPPRPFGHWHLKPARLPIPPPGHGRCLTGRDGPLSTPAARRCDLFVTLPDLSHQPSGSHIVIMPRAAGFPTQFSGGVRDRMIFHETVSAAMRSVLTPDPPPKTVMGFGPGQVETRFVP